MWNKKRDQRDRFSSLVLLLGSLLVMFTLGLTGCTGLEIHFGGSPTLRRFSIRSRIAMASRSR